MSRLSRIVALMALPILTASLVHAADWKDDLKQKFDAVYKYAKRSTANPDRITEPGTILVLQKDGVSGDLSTDLTYSPVKVKDGQVKQTGGFGALLQDKKTTTIFKPGARMYLTNLKVDDDKIQLLLMDVDATAVNVKGSTQQTRYKAAIQFEYDKKLLPTIPFEKLKADIDAVVTPEGAVKAGSTKTISLGQTPEEVEAILGKPDTVVNLGSKRTYAYKTMKVIFQDGKVADVQ